MTRTSIDPNNVPPGSLIAFVQRGMQYLELQANLQQDGQVGAARGTRAACVHGGRDA